jgi:hypothetical protein
MPTLVEVINNHSLLLHIPQEHGNSVKVLFGGADGVLITIDAAGHIHVLPPEGPGEPEVRQAISAVLNGVKVLGNFAGGAALGAGAD